MTTPAPPQNTPPQRVLEALFEEMKTGVSFSPTVWLTDFKGVYPEPFNDTAVKMKVGLFGAQPGNVYLDECLLHFHVVVQVPRHMPGLLAAYSHALQECLRSPKKPILVAPSPRLAYGLRDVTQGSPFDDEKTFLSQRIIFHFYWEELEVSN